MGRKTTILLYISIFLFTLNAKDTVSEWAEELSQLRGKIKLLNSQIEQDSKISEKEEDEFLKEKFSLKSEKDKVKEENKELKQEIKELKQEQLKIEEKDVSLYPFLNEKIDSLIKNVQKGIPFKKSERMGKLNKLKKKIELSEITFYEAATELWRFMQDETKLADEIAFSKTVIEEDNGNSIYADTIRFGMVLMYAQNGRNYDLYLNSGDKTKKFRVTGKKEKEKISNLFASLKRGVEGGLLYLPLPQNPRGENE